MGEVELKPASLTISQN